jgi:hypothetical protein
MKKAQVSPIEIEQAVHYFGDGTTTEISDNVESYLYDKFVSEMPYGVAKARTGDPYNWIFEKMSAMSDSEIRSAFQ